MFGLLWDFSFRFPVGKQSAAWVPEGYIAPFLGVVKTASGCVWAVSNKDRVTFYQRSCLWYRKYA